MLLMYSEYIIEINHIEINYNYEVYLLSKVSLMVWKPSLTKTICKTILIFYFCTKSVQVINKVYFTNKRRGIVCTRH